jgi:hypothetical protein
MTYELILSTKNRLQKISIPCNLHTHCYKILTLRYKIICIVYQLFMIVLYKYGTNEMI